MSIEQLKTISMIRERNRAHSAVDALTEEAIDVLFDDLPKLLAVVEAASASLRHKNKDGSYFTILTSDLLRLEHALAALESEK